MKVIRSLTTHTNHPYIHPLLKEQSFWQFIFLILSHIEFELRTEFERRENVYDALSFPVGFVINRNWNYRYLFFLLLNWVLYWLWCHWLSFINFFLIIYFDQNRFEWNLYKDISLSFFNLRLDNIRLLDFISSLLKNPFL